jgi:hypothetical protein
MEDATKWASPQAAALLKVGPKDMRVRAIDILFEVAGQKPQVFFTFALPLLGCEVASAKPSNAIVGRIFEFAVDLLERSTPHTVDCLKAMLPSFPKISTFGKNALF